jgi:hypothetical protein
MANRQGVIQCTDASEHYEQHDQSQASAENDSPDAPFQRMPLSHAFRLAPLTLTRISSLNSSERWRVIALSRPDEQMGTSTYA